MNTKQDLKSDVLTQIIVRLRICMMKRWRFECVFLWPGSGMQMLSSGSWLTAELLISDEVSHIWARDGHLAPRVLGVLFNTWHNECILRYECNSVV